MKSKSENLIDPNLDILICEEQDPHFGKYPCPCCGDRKAGDRYDCKAILRYQSAIDVLKDYDGSPIIYSVCPDCYCNFQ